MNQSHYPSLELCKKLTELGFPTTFQHIGDSGGTVIGCTEIPKGMYVCPSVMEMLDVIPKEYTFELFSTYWNEYDYGTPDHPYDGELNPLYQLKVYDADECEITGRFMGSRYRNNMPDAIASKILWLHENDYISFNK